MTISQRLRRACIWVVLCPFPVGVSAPPATKKQRGRLTYGVCAVPVCAVREREHR